MELLFTLFSVVCSFFRLFISIFFNQLTYQLCERGIGKLIYFMAMALPSLIVDFTINDSR